jgi:hypothetical protein
MGIKIKLPQTMILHPFYQMTEETKITIVIFTFEMAISKFYFFPVFQKTK